MSKEQVAEMPRMNVYQAIATVQAALAKEGIGKDRRNKDQGYQFRGIDDVYNSLSTHLAETGLCILPRVLNREMRERQTKSGGALFSVVVEAEFDFVCATDGSKHTVKTFGEAMDTADKATNKAMSAAYKYACLQAFCIPTEGDNDADTTTHEVKGKTSSVFDSPEELEQYVINCIVAINKAETIDEIKDQRDLNAAKRAAMKASEHQADRDGYNRIVAAQQAMVEKLKPKTVEAAKQDQGKSLPADVAADPLPY